MQNIQVRTTTMADADVIIECNQLMAMETENKRLTDEIIASGVKRLMQKPQYGFYLVAENTKKTLSLIHI